MKRSDIMAGWFRGQLILSYRKQRVAPLGLGQWPATPKNHWPLPPDLWRLDIEVCDEYVKCVQGSAGRMEGTQENECLWCTYQCTKNSLLCECSHQCFLLCVCQGQKRVWLQGILESRGVCVHHCVCTRRGFPLNTGCSGIPAPRRSWSQISRNLANVRRGSEQENERWESDEGRAERNQVFVFCGPLQGLVRMAKEGWGARDIMWWGGRMRKMITWLISRQTEAERSKKKCET